jgi:hypothetical protein
MRIWRSGNASPCHGEAPGPIPGIRSRGEVAGSNPARGQNKGLRSWPLVAQRQSTPRYALLGQRQSHQAQTLGDLGSNPREGTQ